VVYARTKATLVLDSELQEITPSADISTILAYVYCCGWDTRGWTLHEDNLSGSCLFAFSMYSIDVDRELDQRRCILGLTPLKELHVDWMASKLGLGIVKTCICIGDINGSRLIGEARWREGCPRYGTPCSLSSPFYGRTP
jgi:hypothetical protein